MGQKIDQYHFGWIWLLSIWKTWFHCFYAILLVTFRENHKKSKITIIRYFILYFVFFSKTVGLSSVFNVEMNSTCQNILITAFLWDLEKKAVFPKIFALTIYSISMRTLWAKKLISTILTEFGVLPSKKNDSIVFYGILLVTFRENHKKSEIMVIRYFILYFAFFSKTVGLSSVFTAEMNSACQNALITVFLWDLEKKAVFPRIFALTIVWRSGGYGPKNWSILFWLNLASFHLKTTIPLLLCNSASNF